MALITVGLFSGGTYGFVAGHISPEASISSALALVNDGGAITIDAANHKLTPGVCDTKFAKRLKNWTAPPL